jgi:hypothetical protein
MSERGTLAEEAAGEFRPVAGSDCLSATTAAVSAKSIWS